MSVGRLSLALDAGGLPSEGTILVLGARADSDLAALPPGRVVVVQGFRPDHDALAARGWTVLPAPDGRAATAAVLFIPRARAAARARLAEAAAAVAPGGPIWIDGAKTDGIDALLRELRARGSLGPALAKAHGKIARLDNPGPAALADWQGRDLLPAPGFVAPPGAFSADGVDRGSALLAAALPASLSGAVADLGAGWGWLSAQILARPGVTALHLVEADHAALAAARRNIADPRAQFHWADATGFDPGGRLAAVVTNPPFHVERAADPGLGVAFLRAAAAMLAPSGQLWLVANRHLPYEPVLASLFAEVAEVGGDPGFKVLHAARPHRRAARPVPAAPPAKRRPR